MLRPLKFQRTAGPLGRAFGFASEIGPFGLAFNAGWYVFSIRIRGIGYLQIGTDPFTFEIYASRWSE